MGVRLAAGCWVRSRLRRAPQCPALLHVFDDAPIRVKIINKSNIRWGCRGRSGVPKEGAGTRSSRGLDSGQRQLWGGEQMRLARSWFVAAVLIMPLAGCEYSGLEDKVAVSPNQGGSEKRSFGENVDEVARLLEASADDPGMPSEAESAGEVSIDLAPGDYMVKSACAGVQEVKVSVVQGEKPPLTLPYMCDSVLQTFVRHAGGPITISAIPPVDKPAAAGFTVQPNTDPLASEYEDLSEWSAQQLQPEIPGQFAGSTPGSNSATTAVLFSAVPGSYEVHFICEGPTEVQFSVSTRTGVEVLAPVRVLCKGDVFKASVELPTKGADFNMAPSNGARYAFRLVPAE